MEDKTGFVQALKATGSIDRLRPVGILRLIVSHIRLILKETSVISPAYVEAVASRPDILGSDDW